MRKRPVEGRAYDQTIEHYGVAIKGQNAGFAKSFSGGNTKGVVATHDAGSSVFAKKHIATLSHEAITVEVGMGMGKGMRDWINRSFNQGHATRSGEIISADIDMVARRVTAFTNAHISEVTVPALDGSSKDPCYFTVKIDPERLRHSKPQGRRLAPRAETSEWLVSHFRFELGDLPCERASKIDAFTIKQQVVRDQSKIEVPNIKITFSAADAEPWEDWFKDFVIDGKSSDADELSGSIAFLGPDQKSVLGQIELSHVGIISLQPAKTQANKQDLSRLEAELYVEEIRFDMLVTDA